MDLGSSLDVFLAGDGEITEFDSALLGNTSACA